MMLYRAVLISICHSVGGAMSSEPVIGVHAMAKARIAMSQHAPADEATVRQNRLTWPSRGDSVRAQTETTASAIPGANHVTRRGRVAMSQGCGLG